jgi:hypothetical protein
MLDIIKIVLDNIKGSIKMIVIIVCSQGKSLYFVGLTGA